ncbi:hypothetical protein SCB71_21370 (plasmid) [Herbiconiux sp. KACC 21604]|uniref:hypothetical protein n=1 Tax=unclassified Herbiconiux TaxID=2618217 RepID=UPI001492CCA9|nr:MULTISPECIES: hypothetical protein [unclassified Herbiconiux]QJU56295.1 hypothetical protein HL652_21170 [Herbiconiux sp. SALV-R1]WPO88800.1 hypothetical protein SCB71_21370 [Herbiconiux sp. KACC 21604]
MGWKLPTLAAVTVVTFTATAVLFGMAPGASAGCGSGVVDPGAAGGQSVAGYSGEQLENAGIIMNAAAELGLPTTAQTIGVMTAMGESTLRNLDHGDNAINPDGTVADSVGLFQQQERGYGPLADRMDPHKAATAFFTRLMGVDEWETMAPTLAAHAVQINADPNYYTPFYIPATEVVQTLLSTGGAGECAIGGDAVQLAQQLVDAADQGRLIGSTPDHIKEIRWIAQGQTVPDCGVDVRILQVLVLALQIFDQVGVSDINRKCTGQIEGAGTASSHYFNGGGLAVDFYRLNGQGVTGADGNSIRLITALDPVMPAGARVGQVDCRASAGATVSTTNFTQFEDSCNHLHIDVGFTDGQLTTN